MTTPRYNLDDIVKRYEGATVSIVGNGVTVARPHRLGEGETVPNYPSLKVGDSYVVVSNETVDFDDHPYPIWTVNGGWHYHPKSELGWCMDDMHNDLWGTEKDDNQHPEWTRDLYRNCPIPMMVSMPHYEEFPASVEFPLKEILKAFRIAYFAETINYMIAFAIYCKVKTLNLYGCDYINARPQERATTEFWCGIAHAHGVQLNVTPQSTLLKAPSLSNYFREGFYGYPKNNFPLKIEKDGNREKIIL